MKEVILLVLLNTVLVACGGAAPTPDISAIQTQAVQDAIATMTAQAPSPTLPPTATRIPTPTPTYTSVPTALPSPSPTPSTTLGQETYIVQFGDTLATIADQFDTTMDALIAANGLTYPYTLYVGQKLIINPPPPPLVQSLELTTDLNYGSDHVEGAIRVANRSPVDVNITLQVKTIDADGITLWSDSFTFEDIAASETLRQDLYLGAIEGGSRIDKVQTTIVWAEQTTILPVSSRTDIQLLTRMPILVDDYSSIVVRLRNTTNEYKFAPIMVKYYWSDGSLRLRSYGELGPLGPGETREFRISPTVLSGGLIYAHIYLLD